MVASKPAADPACELSFSHQPGVPFLRERAAVLSGGDGLFVAGRHSAGCALAPTALRVEYLNAYPLAQHTCRAADGFQ